MNLLELSLLFVSLLIGAAGIVLDLFFYLLKRQRLYLYYCLFLTGIFFFLLNSFTGNVFLKLNIPIEDNFWIFRILSFIGVAAFFIGGPKLVHRLLTLKIPRGINIGIYIAAGFISVPVWLPPRGEFYLFWISLTGAGLYMVIITIIFRKRISDPLLKSAVRVFLVTSIILLIFAAARLLPGDHFDSVSANGIILYYINLNILSMIFAYRYFKRPPYMQAGKPTEHFLSRYGITKRESEVIPLLLRGTTNKEIGNELHISPKTVTNHVSNIYEKLRIKNRLQLANLLHNRSI